MEMEDQKWERLFAEAHRIVQETVARMPLELRVEAERVPCLFETWPPDDEEVLGRCLSFEEQVISDAPGPIILYLGTIHQECEELGLAFAEEVRITFLHEFGHHLGLDEADLEERGLL